MLSELSSFSLNWARLVSPQEIISSNSDSSMSELIIAPGREAVKLGTAGGGSPHHASGKDVSAIEISAGVLNLYKRGRQKQSDLLFAAPFSVTVIANP